MVEFENMTVARPWPVSAVSSSQAQDEENMTSDPQPSVRGTLSPGSGGTASLTADLGELRYVRQVALLYTDAEEGLEVQVRAGSSPAATQFSTGFFPATDVAQQRKRAGLRHVLVHLPCRLLHRYWVVEVRGQATLSCGRAVFADALQLEYNPDYGSTSWGYEESDSPDLTDGGAEVLVSREPGRVMRFSVSWGTQDELDRNWEDLGQYQHLAEPLLVVRRPDPHPERHNGIYYGRLRVEPVSAAAFDMHEVQGRIRSMS